MLRILFCRLMGRHEEILQFKKRSMSLYCPHCDFQSEGWDELGPVPNLLPKELCSRKSSQAVKQEQIKAGLKGLGYLGLLLVGLHLGATKLRRAQKPISLHLMD